MKRPIKSLRWKSKIVEVKVIGEHGGEMAKVDQKKIDKFDVSFQQAMWPGWLIVIN